MEHFPLKGKKPIIIAGPCSAETEEQTLATCRALALTGRVDAFRAGVWKPRTQPGMFEGAGVKGLGWLRLVKRETGIPVATEVASARHVESARRHGVDILWLGTRTTVNPFSVQEIASALEGDKEVTILIKNPINPDIALWGGAVERMVAAGVDPRRIGLVHRGFSCFAPSRYRNTPMWQLVLDMRERFPQLAMLCDPSHISGKASLVREVAQRAADLNYDGLMIESHIDPSRALTDPGQQIAATDFGALLDAITWRHPDAGDPRLTCAIEIFRSEIDRLDAELVEILGRRMAISEKIACVKREGNVAILQDVRWREIAARLTAHGQRLGLGDEFLSQLLDAIHMESINRQNRVMNKS